MIQTAQWSWKFDETVPHSDHYQDIYHSLSGGEEQAREVFLKGNGFPERWQQDTVCTILETGFGIGLNFLSTWKAWKDAGSKGTLHFLSIERTPFKKEDLQHILSAFPNLQHEAQALLNQWIFPISGLHRLIFEQGNVILTLAFGDIRALLKEWVAQVDAFYFDGFSPEKNPEMWDIYLFKQCAQLAKPGATIATYTVAGSVRRALKEAGFIVEKLQGFGTKRHRLAGFYQGFSTTHRRSQQKKMFIPWPDQKPKRVAVIGAGIAGCSVVERLTLRHVEVVLFDQHSGPAQQTSSNIAGVIYPLISQDNNRSDRITRAAYLWWQQQREHWCKKGMIGEFNGVVQLAKSDAHAQLQHSLVHRQSWPEEYMTFLDIATASQKTGYNIQYPAYWFPKGGWVNPLSLCQAMLAEANAWLHCCWNTKVTALLPQHSGWTVQTSQGTYDVDQVILANAWESEQLLPEGTLDLKRIFGQVHSLSNETLPQLKTVMCQDGYIVPPQTGYGCMGATFEWENQPRLSYSEALINNQQRIQNMIPGLQQESLITTEVKGNWRTSTFDRLPLIGSLNVFEHPLWTLLALGSRGLVWGPLCGEIIASALCKEPLPLEYTLLQALSPNRKPKK